MYKKISDYGIVGNLNSVALIGLDGSIDWLCLPHIDSPSVFGALLDDAKGGRFSITPTTAWQSTSEYLPDTNILVTTFRTESGTVELTDFMPIPRGEAEEMEEEHELYRLLKVRDGFVRVRVTFEPRFDYARARSTLEIHQEGILARGDNGDSLMLSANVRFDVQGDRASADIEVSPDRELLFHVAFRIKTGIRPCAETAHAALDRTAGFWRSWLERSETGRSVDLGPYRDRMYRSALVLKLLYYHQTGTVAAAATTSLPEEVGGERNWDYRYTWIRDSSFTLEALLNLGHLTEMEGYLRWIEKVLSERGAENIQVLYGLRGEKRLPEHTLDHLDGYRGSRPVRVGNAAATQRQLDIYGELMDAALRMSNYAGKIDAELWPLLRSVCDFVVGHWQNKDSGIWEVRGGPYHFVYSKVMCWVALDRGMNIAKRYGFEADFPAWENAAAAIRADVLERGWNKEKQSFVQHYDSDSLDASNLLIPALGFLPWDDPRVLGTVEATARELMHEGFLYRYTAADGLPGGEGTFLLCTFWLVDCFVALGRLGDAETLLARMEGVANHLGIFSEEYDVKTKEALGNVPQALTHIGYINSVVRLQKAKKSAEEQGSLARRQGRIGLLSLGMKLLNDGEPQEHVPHGEIAPRLKTAMNILRGAFFDRGEGRVAYEIMRGSPPYRSYVGKSYSLKDMDLGDLDSRDRKIAFWVNLYNVLVVHAVVELGIRDSVTEVPGFFRRVRYRVGDYLFSPDDIEHGILRANRRPPGRPCKRFRGQDPRKRFVVDPPDPRIHFALVCASSSCPPIEVYTAERLDEQLRISGQAFLNGGGLELDSEHDTVRLSRIFKWYGSDFGRTEEELLRFLTPYLYRKEDRTYLADNAGRVTVQYLPYDWRLNRS